MVARRAHNPEVVGSSPASATKKDSQPFGWLSFLFAAAKLVLRSPDYESDERSSLGKRGERCLWQMKRPKRSAAVEKIEDQHKPEDFFGHRKPGVHTEMPTLTGQAQTESCLRNQIK